MGIDMAEYKEWIDQIDRLSYKDLREIRHALRRLEKWGPFRNMVFDVADIDTWQVLITMAMVEKGDQYSEIPLLHRITRLLSKQEWDPKTGQYLKDILAESGWWVEK